MNIKNVNVYNNQLNSGLFKSQIRSTNESKANIVFSKNPSTDTVTFSPVNNYIARKYSGHERKLMMGYFKSAETIDEISAFEETHALKYLNTFSEAANKDDKNYVAALSDKYAELYDNIQKGDFANEDEKKQALEILDKTFGYMAENVSEEVGDMADKELNAASNYAFNDVDAKRLAKVKAFSVFERVFDKSAFVDYVKNLADSIKKYIKENGKAPTDEFVDNEAKSKGKAFEHMSSKELKHIGGFVFGNNGSENFEGVSKKYKNIFRKAKIQLNLAKNAEEELSVMEQKKKRLESIQKSMEESLRDYTRDEKDNKTNGKENGNKSVNLLINKSVKGLVDKLIKEAGVGKEEAEELRKLLSNANLHGAGEVYKRHLNTKIGETKKQIRAINRTDKSAVFGSSEAKYNLKLLNRINEELKDE